MVNSTLLSVLNDKIVKLAKYSFKNKSFGFDFIKKIIISIILKKPYYITMHELHIDSLKSIFKIFSNFNFFNINMKDVDDMHEIIGFSDENHVVQTIGFSPRAEIVVFDNIWNTNSELIRNLSDLISTNTYNIENVMINSNTKIFVGTSSFETKPNLKYAKLWNVFFIKDQYISKIDNLDEILNLDIINKNEKINDFDLNNIEENYDDIVISLPILRKIMAIKAEIILANKPFENKSSSFESLVIDDKSWDSLIKAIKISAFIDGKQNVEFDDLNIIVPIVCSLPIQYDIVSKIISDVIFRETKITLPISKDKLIDNGLVEKISAEILSEFKKIDTDLETLKSHRKKEIKREKRLEIVRNNFNIFHENGSLIDPSEIFNTYNSVDEIISDLPNNNWIPNYDLPLLNDKTMIDDSDLVNDELSNKSERLVHQDDFANLDFGNNKPRIYSDKPLFVNAKNTLKVEKLTSEQNELESIKAEIREKIELARAERYLNLNADFKNIEIIEKEKTPPINQVKDFNVNPNHNNVVDFQKDKINYNKILFGSYSSFRKMVLESISHLSFGDVKTYKKPFTNLIDTFYLLTDENENSFMGSSKYLDQINHSRPSIEVPICSKNEYFNNENILNSKVFYFLDNKYYIKNNNKNCRIIFSLVEVKNEIISPSLISISLIQKFVKDGSFLIDYFSDMESKIKLKLNDDNHDKNYHDYVVNLLASFLIVKNKLINFLKWIKDSNEIEGSIKTFLPEYSSL